MSATLESLVIAHDKAETAAGAAYAAHSLAEAAAWKALEEGGGDAHQAALPAVQRAHVVYQVALWERAVARYTLARYRLEARCATRDDHLVRPPGRRPT